MATNNKIKNETKVEGSTRNNAESEQDQRYEHTKKCHKDLLTEISAVTLSLAKGEYKGFRRSEIDSDFSGQREGESVIVVTSNFVINVLGKSYKDEITSLYLETPFCFGGQYKWRQSYRWLRVSVCVFVSFCNYNPSCFT